MRDDFEITTPQLDLAVETARAAGALGARMTGGGFGGSAILLVKNTQRDAILREVERRFAARFEHKPAFRAARASDGARSDALPRA